MANEATTKEMRSNPLILTVRGQRVMMDSDLAGFYKISTSQMVQALKRNSKRFPSDFAFQLTRQEVATLISQFVISKNGQGGRRTLPWVFTEHGAIMLAGILNSPVAIEASVRIVRAFVYLREQIANNHELAEKFTGLDNRLNKHDKAIAALFEAITQLLEPATADEKREIGFHVKEQAIRYRTKNRK